MEQAGSKEWGQTETRDGKGESSPDYNVTIKLDQIPPKTKINAACFSEIFVSIYISTRRQNSENIILNILQH
jgi:hypothetical protein